MARGRLVVGPVVREIDLGGDGVALRAAGRPYLRGRRRGARARPGHARPAAAARHRHRRPAGPRAGVPRRARQRDRRSSGPLRRSDRRRARDVRHAHAGPRLQARHRSAAARVARGRPRPRARRGHLRGDLRARRPLLHRPRPARARRPGLLVDRLAGRPVRHRHGRRRAVWWWPSGTRARASSSRRSWDPCSPTSPRAGRPTPTWPPSPSPASRTARAHAGARTSWAAEARPTPGETRRSDRRRVAERPPPRGGATGSRASAGPEAPRCRRFPGVTETSAPEITFRSDVSVELVKASASDADVVFAARVSTKGEQSLEDVDADTSRSARPHQLPDARPARQPVRAQLVHLLRPCPDLRVARAHAAPDHLLQRGVRPLPRARARSSTCPAPSATSCSRASPAPTSSCPARPSSTRVVDAEVRAVVRPGVRRLPARCSTPASPARWPASCCR